MCNSTWGTPSKEPLSTIPVPPAPTRRRLSHHASSKLAMGGSRRALREMEDHQAPVSRDHGYGGHTPTTLLTLCALPPPCPLRPVQHHVELLGPGPLLHHFLEHTFIPERSYVQLLGGPIATRVPSSSSITFCRLGSRSTPSLGAAAARYPPQPSVDPDARPLRFTDDQLGRTLDQLFDLDRASLLTEIVVRIDPGVPPRPQRIHND